MRNARHVKVKEAKAGTVRGFIQRRDVKVMCKRRAR
jgi:hypothetical protein